MKFDARYCGLCRLIYWTDPAGAMLTMTKVCMCLGRLRQLVLEAVPA